MAAHFRKPNFGQITTAIKTKEQSKPNIQRLFQPFSSCMFMTFQKLKKVLAYQVSGRTMSHKAKAIIEKAYFLVVTKWKNLREVT